MKQSHIIFISSIVVLTLATSVGVVFYLYSLRPDWFGVKSASAEQASNNIKMTTGLIARKLKLSKLATAASANDFNTEISDFNSAAEGGTDYEKELRERSEVRDRKAAPPNKNLIIIPPSPPTLEIPPEPEISVPKLETAPIEFESPGQQVFSVGSKQYYIHQFRVRNLFGRPGFDAIILGFSTKQNLIQDLYKQSNFISSEKLSLALTTLGKPGRHYVTELDNDFVLEQSRELKEPFKASLLMKQYFESLITSSTNPLKFSKIEVGCVLNELFKIQDSHAAILYNYRKDRMNPIQADPITQMSPDKCIKYIWK